VVRGRSVAATRRRRAIRTTAPIAAATVASAALLAATAAHAQQSYPPPGEPGQPQTRPKGPHRTLTVCHKRHRCDFRTIQKAVRHARAGDTIRVRRGTYREAVTITGRGKRYLRLIGDARHPGRVILEGRNEDGNGVLVNNADHVTVRGFTARNYTSNGFFVTNVTGYTLRNLVARHTGVYGLYAFNSIGGSMSDSEAYQLNDGALYIGQTPPQARPRRTFVTNVSGHDSAIGFSATNMRYVTIRKSRFFNNALGVVPNALDSEKYPPPEDNIITDNDIFWNNFDFHKGAPFAVKETGTAALAPVGTGLLLLGGRGNRVEGNRIFGNYLAGVGAIDGILLQENPDAIELQRNTVRGNHFGRGGLDANGRDVIYDGSGSGNCFGPNDWTAPTLPATTALPACPFTGVNAHSDADRQTMLGWIGEGALSGWREKGHPPYKRFKPLEIYTKPTHSTRRHSTRRHSSRHRTVSIGDNYFAPTRLKVARGTKVTWRWPGADVGGDVHDVKLGGHPKGAKGFHSRPASNDFSFTRRLRVAGTYHVLCTFHEGMRMTIRVRR
jgi:plastocyanin